MDDWRAFLYPLGFLSGLAFGARFIIQWLASEKAGESLAPRSFWQLSLIGNLLLMLHSLIQVQFHVCLIQSCNAVISWRNLNFIQTERPAASFKTVCFFLAASISFTVLIFAIQDWFLSGQLGWFRSPVAPWHSSPASSVPLTWHIVGTVAYMLFSSRFWIQWWYAETEHASRFPQIFWWLSLIGALFSIAYFLRINDSVNLIGPLVGIVPYLRNLMLMRKNRVSL
jgi:lipid-A-disaccharide synthase